ncbi:hypothetical protein FB45DRAFT_979468 [Roridomyces roridus]|uniref:ZZ-type domain-containing protein n=1 Tax=Roridomyces roridus TaxID=1738132 RepID=A0AAD7BRX6_9AGAR|nr:hypothetical protein FB45DRAFT_979468 [Roridomyces roridus]
MADQGYLWTWVEGYSHNENGLSKGVCAHTLPLKSSLRSCQIDPDSRPAALVPPFTGHFRVILDTPCGMQQLHPGTRHLSAGQAGINRAKKPAPTPASLELRSSIYQTSNKSARPIDAAEAEALANGTRDGSANGTSRSSGGSTCDTCGADCMQLRYHSLKDKKFELCSPCYLDGRFPSTIFSGDFVKLTSAAASGRLQCIRKFLELPIEDPYLATEASMGPLRHSQHIPFEQADNPVMRVVAFLAGVVGPGVAADAAKTALHHLTREEKTQDSGADGVKREGTNGASSSKPPTPAAEAMSVDGIPPKKLHTSSAKAALALADAEDAQIRSTLASLIKLTLSKLEMKMTQFEGARGYSRGGAQGARECPNGSCE